MLTVTKEGKEATNLFLEAGANLQATDIYNTSKGEIKRSLFERALEANDLPMCQIFLENGADAGAQLMQDHHYSQLWEYVEQNDTEAVAVLLRFGARANDIREGLPNSALGLAITQENRTMIALLQSAGVTGVGHETPFIASFETALSPEQTNLLSQLLWANGKMIFTEAILAQNEPLINLLLSYRIDQQGRGDL